MSKNKLKVISSMLMLVLIFSLFVTTTLGWHSLTHTAINNFWGDGLGYAVFLQKLEKDVDSHVTELPVPGAEFYLYKETASGDIQMDGRFVSDADGRVEVYLKPGNYYFEETNPGYAYVYDRDSADEPITRYYFTVVPDHETQDAVVTAYNRRIAGSLVIEKTVWNANGSTLTEQQRGIEFEFTVTFSDEGAYTYTIDGGAEQTLESGGTLTLKNGQKAIFDRIPVGVQYIVTETPRLGYAIRSTNHQGHIPPEGAVARFANSYGVFSGSLEISKQVGGPGANINKEFEFTVTFADDGTYMYTIGDGAEQPLKSGETLKLRHGQTAVFHNLPVGLGYNVTEHDYSAEGYMAAVREMSGAIIPGGSKAGFYNVYTTDTLPGSLEISKQVSGDGADKNKEFAFTVTFSDGGSYSYKIDGGAAQTHTSGGIIRLKHGQTALFENLPSGVTYTVAEDDYTAERYTASARSISGAIVSGAMSKAAFCNDKPDVTVLTVEKLVEGDIPEEDIDKESHFTATINGEKIEFILKHGEKKMLILPINTIYEILEDDYFADGYLLSAVINGSGTATEQPIECIFTNTYIGPVYIEIEGEKTWNIPDDLSIDKPGSITVYLKNGDIIVERMLVMPDDDGNWTYTFTAPKYDADGNEIVYTIEEKPIDGFLGIVNEFDIENIYVGTATYDPLVQKIIAGDTPKTSASFSFKLTAIDNAPMPDGSAIDPDTGQYSRILTINGSGTKGFGSIQFVSAGTYHYTIQEIAGQADGYTYDETIYHLAVVVGQQGNDLIVESAIFTKDGDDDSEPYDLAVFTNLYTAPPTTEVSVTKVWIGDHPDQPQSVQVQLYGDGEPYGSPVTLSHENDWTYTWTELDGDVEWTVDEPHVPDGYIKQIAGGAISGYIIINTFDEPIDPSRIIIRGSKTWNHGTNPETDFPQSITVYLKNQYGVIIAQQEISAADYWSWAFEVDRYDAEGIEYIYTIDEAPILGYTKHIHGYNITNNHDSYEYIVIVGQKYWEHGTNTDRRPESITVYVKNGDEIVVQAVFTEADDWKYVFILPRFDEDGKEIKYTIGEANVPYYTMRTDGYNLINKFKGFDYPGDTPKTGDNNNLWVWVSLMYISLVLLIITHGIEERRRKINIFSYNSKPRRRRL